MRLAATAVVLLGVIPHARADSWAPPRTLTAISPSGAYNVALVPGEGLGARPSLGVSDGGGQTVWSRVPVNLIGAMEAAVSDDGHVATVDDYLSAGGRHSVVIYDPKGRLVADHDLDDFLTREEIERKVEHSASSRWWRYTGDELAIVGNRLLVTARWGETIAFSLKDGRPARDPRRFGRLQDYLGGTLPSEERIMSVTRIWPTRDVARDLCALSAAGCRCQRGTVLGQTRGPVRTRPLAPAQWKSLTSKATVLVPLTETDSELVTDPAKVQIELLFRRKNARWDAYHLTIDPRAAQGDVARLVKALLDATGL